MSRAFFDVDKEIDRQRVQQQILNQREALDNQRVSPKPVDQRYRDGRMSEEEYNNFEQSSLSYFKEQLLKRIQWNSKLLSQYDLLQAQEFADMDPEFKRRFDEARNEQNVAKPVQLQNQQDIIPEKVSKFQQLMQMRQNKDQFQEVDKQNIQQEQQQQEERMKTTIQLYKPSQESNNSNKSWLERPKIQSTEQDEKMSMQQIALQISNTMSILLQQQQQLITQYNSPNQQITEILREVKEQRKEFHNYQNQQNNQTVNQLQSKVEELSRKIQQQELETKIGAMNSERLQLQKDMREFNEQKHRLGTSQQLNQQSKNTFLTQPQNYEQKKKIIKNDFAASLSNQYYNPSSSRNSQRNGLSPRQLEDRNKQRQKVVNIIKTEFSDAADQRKSVSKSDGQKQQITPFTVNSIVNNIIKQPQSQQEIFDETIPSSDHTINAQTTIIQNDEDYQSQQPPIQTISNRGSIQK